VDAPVKVATMPLPDGINAVNLEPSIAPPPVAGGSAVFDGWMAQAPTWDDFAWLRRQTELSLLIKGILYPDDAGRALDAGCNGIVVSNHGGRVIQGTPASIDALPHIVKRVAGRVPVLFDSGIRQGRDVFVALARGATAVLIGRPYIWGLAANGAMGVAHVIRLLRDELEMTMALTGCAHLGDIDQSCLADYAYPPK
jgi:4-hydroxymandelate oxidase